jgi:hypothetical protein
MPNGLVRMSRAPASNAACRSGSVGQVSSRIDVGGGLAQRTGCPVGARKSAVGSELRVRRGRC